MPAPGGRGRPGRTSPSAAPRPRGRWEPLCRDVPGQRSSWGSAEGRGKSLRPLWPPPREGVSRRTHGSFFRGGVCCRQRGDSRPLRHPAPPRPGAGLWWGTTPAPARQLPPLTARPGHAPTPSRSRCRSLGRRSPCALADPPLPGPVPPSPSRPRPLHGCRSPGWAPAPCPGAGDGGDGQGTGREGKKRGVLLPPAGVPRPAPVGTGPPPRARFPGPGPAPPHPGSTGPSPPGAAPARTETALVHWDSTGVYCGGGNQPPARPRCAHPPPPARRHRAAPPQHA